MSASSPQHKQPAAPIRDATFTSSTLEFDGSTTTFMLLLAAAELRIWAGHSEHLPGKN